MMTPDDPRHGTVAGHVAGCHCDPCQSAKYRYEKRRHRDAQLGRPRRIPAIGAQRRVQALMVMGWTARAIADAGGWLNAENIVQILSRRELLRSKADRVARVYDQLSGRVGPSQHVRRRSLAKGWAPPVAWDDDELDDPEAIPHHLDQPDELVVDWAVVERVLAGEHLDTNRLERLAVLARWHGSTNELDDIHGWNLRRDQRTQRAAEAADQEDVA